MLINKMKKIRIKLINNKNKDNFTSNNKVETMHLPRNCRMNRLRMEIKNHNKIVSTMSQAVLTL